MMGLFRRLQMKVSESLVKAIEQEYSERESWILKLKVEVLGEFWRVLEAFK